jgi:hypothetical protein
VEVTASRRGLRVGEGGGRSLELLSHQVPLLRVSRLLLVLANHPHVPLTSEGVSLAMSERGQPFPSGLSPHPLDTGGYLCVPVPELLLGLPLPCPCGGTEAGLLGDTEGHPVGFAHVLGIILRANQSPLGARLSEVILIAICSAFCSEAREINP